MFRQETVTVTEVEYTLQKIPFKFYIGLMDKHTDKHGVFRKTGYIEDLFKHVVISPKITLDSFDSDFESAFELVQEIESFLKSKDKPKSDQEESEE